MTRRRILTVGIAVVALAGGGLWLRAYLLREHPAAAVIPSQWATSMSVPGLPNLHKVTDQLYRGAQPTAEGCRQLKVLGIKTIVNLRSLHSDAEAICDTGIVEVRIRTNPWRITDGEVVEFLKVVTDPARTPVYVHCQHGSDRTGTMCAVYRMVVCGWSSQDAVREMTEGGLGFHDVWQNLVEYLDKLDVAALRAQAGLNGSPAAKPAN